MQTILGNSNRKPTGVRSRRQTNLPIAAVALAVVAITGLLTGCGSDAAKSTQSPSRQAFPVSVQASNGSVAIAARPSHIISLSPTATETLYAVGAGGQVLAADDDSDYPAEVPHAGLSSYTPNAEAVAQKRPDLVVVSSDANGLVDALTKLKIPVLVQPAAANFDDVYAQIQAIGTASGHQGEALALISTMRKDIAAAQYTTVQPTTPLSVYYELDNTLYSASSNSFIGQIFALFGVRNIADAADKAKSGYPQLSAEYVISSNPDLIFLADSKCCSQSAATLSQRPGWANVAAIRDGKVISLDDDVASRWGPRTVDLVHAIGVAVRSVTASSSSSLTTAAAR